ncbi:MAG: hypothetical protein NTX22_16040 [Ignavibacteriales bacterium]|nr:hypothetical protein [Ignavibacteriales bacterium]
MVNVYGFILTRKRYTKKFFQILDFYLTNDKTENFQLDYKKISNLINGSKYYSLKNENDFYSTPLLNKLNAKLSYKEIINQKFVNSYLSTSGTTGEVFKYPVSNEFLYHQWALFWKFRIINGIKFNSWCAYLYGKPLIEIGKVKPPFWIKDYFTKQLLLSYPHLTETTIKKYLELIKENNIKWIHGYPSALIQMNSLVQKLKLEDLARSLKLILITCSSEVIYEYQKKEIELTFGCNVKQLYGLTEGAANIFECEHSNLHVDESFSFVEFIKVDGEGSCKIVGTNYHNKAFPLLRYDTGDNAIVYNSDFQCPCGRKSRVVKEISGRAQEALFLKNNTKLVTAPLIFKKSYNIRRAQIVQKQKGEAEFCIIKGPKYTLKDEKILISQIKNYLGSDFIYNITYMEKLKTSVQGKVPFIISEINGK